MGDDHQEDGGTGSTASGHRIDLWVRSLEEADVRGIDSEPLHRFCGVIPWHRVPLLRNREPDSPVPEGDREFQYLGPYVRVALQYAPLFVFLATATLVVAAEFLDRGIDGPSVFVPAIPFAWAILGVGWVVVMLLLFAHVGLLDELGEFLELVEGTVVYGLLILLGLGTALSIGFVITGDEFEAGRNVVFISGYLFTLLLGSLLVYDGMLRTETLFSNLNALVQDQVSGCEAFLTELRSALEKEIPHLPWLRTVHVFAVVFVVPPGIVWYTGTGPQNLSWNLSLAINLVLDLFIVMVAFQFLVLNRLFSQLISDRYVPEDADGTPLYRTETGDPAPLRLGYEPDHPDGRGGYRAFGRFATRVNAILVLAGLYVVFRLYVQGGRAFPLAGSTEVVIWVASYVMPVAAYAVVALVWVYYSFWRLHRKMATELMYVRRERGGVSVENPPVWPVGNRQLASMVSANAVPVLLAIPRIYDFALGLG